MGGRLNSILREANFLSLLANVFIAIFGFAGFALLARSYSVELFGQWVLFVSSAGFIEMFRFGITNTAIIRFLSGATEKERTALIGSNSLINIIATLIISLVLIICLLLFPDPIKRTGYELFFLWYPLMAIINLPFNTAQVILQADQEFGKILKIKLLNSGGFFLIVLASYIWFNLTLTQLVLGQAAMALLTSAYCLYNGWDGLKHFRKSTRSANHQLLHFGKYTTFTLIGSNLLRNADTLIISLSPLGAAAVALYSIPLKLTELQQIPLRSFVATAFPKMSKASIEHQTTKVKNLFYTYSGAMFLLFIPFSLVPFIFAEFFVLMLGGSQYLATDLVTGGNAVVIMQIFAIYGMLLPIDRMTGVGLDSINQPQKNFIKVMIMVATNVIADLVAVFIFGSLELVAAGSVLFTILGLVIGYKFLDNHLSLNVMEIFRQGFVFYRNLYKKALQIA